MTKPLDGLIIRPPTPADADALFDLGGKVFSGGGYFRQRNHCRDGYIRHSHYDWAVSQIALLDERLVAHFGVWRYGMRIGGARVRTGGIGTVMTHGDYRKRGLIVRTAPVAMQAMREAGYDLSILFGVRNYYGKFGYVRAWNETTWNVPVADLPKDAPAASIRTFSPDRCADEWHALYNRENARLTGTAVRPTYQRHGLKEYKSYAWRDAKGKLAGCVIVKPGHERMECFEFAGDVEQVLRVLGKLGRKWNCKSVEFGTLHYEHPLCKRIRRGDCVRREEFVRCGRAMVRTINLESTLRKMAAELSRRLKRSPLAGWRGDLRIADPRETVTLRIARGAVTLAPASKRKPAGVLRGGEEIAQLLIGATEPEETVESYGTRVTGEAKGLLPILFPNQHPTLGNADDF
jgi:predicted N-acetyltransferase YhbS